MIVPGAFTLWLRQCYLKVFVASAMFLSWGGLPAFAQVDDLTDLSIEELDALTIAAASKRVQPLFETPAAVTVLLPVDVKRSGHPSVADALRLVPGAQVAQQVPGRWMVGVRGFSGLTSSKLLVLVDGRSVYSPFYGSVEWANADLPLDDLARIEVVRGPGATLWGANAVNGIVNVISKDARETQGSIVAVRGGTGEPLSLHLRHGDKLGERTWYRVFFSASDTDGVLGSLRDDPLADYRNRRIGWRSDTELTDRLQLTWQAEYVDRDRIVEAGRSEYDAGILAARLSGRDVLGGDFQLQAYVDRSRNQTGGGLQNPTVPRFPLSLNEDSLNLDLDLTHSLRAVGRHAITWGGGVRRMESDVKPAVGLAVVREHDVQWVYNAFVQDDVSLSDTLRLTVGSKFEHHETIGWQPQPNLRISWLPNRQNTVWASVSHAVRAPSRAEREILLQLAPVTVPGSPLPIRPELVGNADYAEERNTAYEAGWRWRPSARFSTDLAAYVFDYDDVRDLPSTTLFEPQPVPVIVQRYTTNNEGDASSYGAEASWQWRPNDGWEMAGGLSYTKMRDEGLAANRFQAPEFAVSTWTGHVRSWWQLPRDLEFSTVVYGASRNPLAGLPARLRLDGQLSWHPRPDLELAVGVQRANDPRSSEINTRDLLPLVEDRRSVYLRIRWRY